MDLALDFMKMIYEVFRISFIEKNDISLVVKS